MVDELRHLVPQGLVTEVLVDVFEPQKLREGCDRSKRVSSHFHEIAKVCKSIGAIPLYGLNYPLS